MYIKRSQKIRLGLFVSLGIFLFVVAVYIIGTKQNMFASTITINSRFKDVKGLQVGNNVRFSGIDVGNVADIQFISDSTVKVEMSIQKRVIKFIRKDSKVEVGTEGLMGNKMLVIRSGSPDSPVVEEGDYIKSVRAVNYEEILEEVSNNTKRATEIINNLSQITTKINVGSGDIGRLLNDTVIVHSINKASGEVLKISDDFQSFMASLNSTSGDIGKLIHQDSLTTSIQQILNRFDSVSHNAMDASIELKKATRSLNEGTGVVNMALNDSSFADSLRITLNNINDGINDVMSASQKIQKSWLLSIFSGEKKKKRDSLKKSQQTVN